MVKRTTIKNIGGAVYGRREPAGKPPGQPGDDSLIADRFQAKAKAIAKSESRGRGDRTPASNEQAAATKS